MKIKKISAIVLVAVMLLTMSVPAFAETYVVNDFAENYVICEEYFSNSEIANNMISITGTHEVKNGFTLIRPGAELKADLRAYGKSVNDGIVNVAFNFEPNLNGSETNDTATQLFDLGGGFVLEAQWSEYPTPSSWIADGKFKVGGQEIVKFNADATGDFGAGNFRSIGAENAAPSLYYKINAKINLNTNKVNLTIVEKETTKVNDVYNTTEESIVNEEYDYIRDSFEYLSASLASTGTDRFNSLLSNIKISIEGEASYAGVPNDIEQYPEGYVFENKGDSYVTITNGQSYKGNVKASSGIVDVSYRFWPSESTYETNVDKPVSQTFKFGEGFSFDAQWSSYGAAWWCQNGKINVGNQTIIMNKDGWNGTAGWFRPKDKYNSSAAQAYYDVSARVNLDTKKINITIVEHLEIQAATDNVKETVILNNAEFNYNAASFDGFETTLTSDSTYMESHNSKLLIKAVTPVTYDEKAVMTYSDGHIFEDKGTAETKLINGQSYTGNAKATSGIIDVSYRVLPTISSYEAQSYTATQVFDFGGGFSFNAQWSCAGSYWSTDGKFNVGSTTVTMNEDGWNAAGYAGYLRARSKVSESAAYGYYDITAKINLDTKKINLTIVENLATTAETKAPEVIHSGEYAYNSHKFDGFETTLTAGANFLESYNNNLVIKADGPVAYDDKIVGAEVFANEGNAEQCLTDTMTKQVDWNTETEIIDISYTFRPDMNDSSGTCEQAVQTFEFGNGFSFDARWTPYGGAMWLINGHFNIGDITKRMNPTKWMTDTDNLGSGCFRPKGNNREPFAYYDISAQINLKTSKIKVSIVEYLEMNDGTINETEILPETEYDYSADTFNFFKTSLATSGNTYLQSHISNLFIQEYIEPAVEPEFIEGGAVIVKNEKGAVNTFEEFAASKSPSVNLTFKNPTGNDLNAVLIIAYYKGDSIVKLDAIRNIQADGEYENIEYNYNFVKADADYDSVKAFVWDGMQNIAPAKVSAEIQ